MFATRVVAIRPLPAPRGCGPGRLLAPEIQLGGASQEVAAYLAAELTNSSISLPARSLV